MKLLSMLASAMLVSTVSAQATKPANIGEDGRLLAIPFAGGETTFGEIIAHYPENRNGEFVVIGCGKVSDFYVCEYEAARDTHYSVLFSELSAINTPSGDGDAIYISRAFGETMIKALGETQKRGGPKALRLKVEMRRPFDRRCDKPQFEVVDWQQLNADATAWGDWQIEPVLKETREAVAAERKREAAAYAIASVRWTGGTSKRYHKAGCSSLRGYKNVQTLTRKEATALDLKPCSRCQP